MIFLNLQRAREISMNHEMTLATWSDSNRNGDDDDHLEDVVVRMYLPDGQNLCEGGRVHCNLFAKMK